MRYFYLFFLMLLVFSSCGKEDKKDTSNISETEDMKYRRPALPNVFNEKKFYSEQDIIQLFARRQEIINYLKDDKNKDNPNEYSKSEEEFKTVNETIQVLELCKDRDSSNLEEVEYYKGDLGVTKEFVDERSTYVGRIQWLDNFGNKFRGPNDSEGEVIGKNMGTCTLISDDLAITAGHIFREDNRWGLIFPKKNRVTISDNDAATLMQVVFNLDRNTEEKHSATISFSIEKLEDIKNESDIDYAIIRLGKENNVTAGEKFGFAHISNKNADVSDVICLIQYPDGEAKQIGAGLVSYKPDKFTKYDNIDTKNVSSGSAIFSAKNGMIVGVHTHGGCKSVEYLYNYGSSIEEIISYSTKIQNLLNQ